jgi:hypothetical protein
MVPLSNQSKTEANDLLWGVEAIAAYIGRNVRQTYYALQTQKIPGQKSGALWVSRKSTIDRVLTGGAE